MTIVLLRDCAARYICFNFRRFELLKILRMSCSSWLNNIAGTSCSVKPADFSRFSSLGQIPKSEHLGIVESSGETEYPACSQPVLSYWFSDDWRDNSAIGQ